MAKNYLKASAKTLSTVAGPFGAPFEFLLSLYEDEQSQKREAQLDAMILEGQNLNRETLEEIFQARGEIKQLREQFILGMQACLCILAQNRELLSSPEKIEQKLPFLLEPQKKKLEGSGFVTEEVLADELYKYYETDSRLFLTHIHTDFPVGELRPNEALPVIISDFLTRCSGQAINQQLKIFNTLSKKNPGSQILRVKTLMLQEQVLNQIGG